MTSFCFVLCTGKRVTFCSHKNLFCVQAARGQHTFNMQPCHTFIGYKL